MSTILNKNSSMLPRLQRGKKVERKNEFMNEERLEHTKSPKSENEHN